MPSKQKLILIGATLVVAVIFAERLRQLPLVGSLPSA